MPSDKPITYRIYDDSDLRFIHEFFNKKVDNGRTLNALYVYKGHDAVQWHTSRMMAGVKWSKVDMQSSDNSAYLQSAEDISLTIISLEGWAKRTDLHSRVWDAIFVHTKDMKDHEVDNLTGKLKR